MGASIRSVAHEYMVATAAIALVVASTTAQALPQIENVTCGNSFSSSHHTYRVRGEAKISEQERKLYVDDQTFAQTSMNEIRDWLLNRCAPGQPSPNAAYPPVPAVYPIGSVYFRVTSPSGLVLEATWNTGDNGWEINFPARESATRDQRRELLLKQFTDAHRVQAYVSPDILFANPFPYRGKVVGVRATFQRMYTEATGLFYAITPLTQPIPLYLLNIPSSEFNKPDDMVLLAFKLEGLRHLLDARGAKVDVLTGAYVGHSRCQKFGCHEFMK